MGHDQLETLRANWWLVECNDVELRIGDNTFEPNEYIAVGEATGMVEKT